MRAQALSVSPLLLLLSSHLRCALCARLYTDMQRDPKPEERIDGEWSGSPCQPSFYVIGAMKAATTELASELSRTCGPNCHSRSMAKSSHVLIHPNEDHFWEDYPAYGADWGAQRWEREVHKGGEQASMFPVDGQSQSFQDLSFHEGAAADDAYREGLKRFLARGYNGSYLGFKGLPVAPWPLPHLVTPWPPVINETAQKRCELLVQGMAPARGHRNEHVERLCESIQGTLAACVLAHHRTGYPIPPIGLLHQNSSSPASNSTSSDTTTSTTSVTSEGEGGGGGGGGGGSGGAGAGGLNRTQHGEATRALCRRHQGVGIKAPSHLSEYHVPLRLSACAAPRVRFLISLRDPVTRAYSAFLYKRLQWGVTQKYQQHPALRHLAPLHFAQSVELELAGLSGLDLTQERLVSGLDWKTLYVRLLWQERGGCNPKLWGGHDKLAGVVKGLYEPQLRHWLDAFDNDCSRFLVSLLEEHTAVSDRATKRAVQRQTLRFVGLGQTIPNTPDWYPDRSPPAEHAAEAATAAATNSSPSAPGSQSPPAATPRPTSPTEGIPPMYNATREQLAEFFRPANEALAALLLRRCRRVPLGLAGEEGGKEGGKEGGHDTSQIPGGLLELRSRRSWLARDASESFAHNFVSGAT
jgi:hypothetical protein